MNTLIRLRPEELTEDFFQHLKSIANTADRIEIKITRNDAANNLSEVEINNRLAQLNKQQTVSFSMEELSTYMKQIAE